MTSRSPPGVSGSLVAFGPYALYPHTGYSEPLYFALCTGALLVLRRNRWLAAGLLGAACSATRLVGVFLVLPMLAHLVGRGDRVSGPSERGARLDVRFRATPLRAGAPVMIRLGEQSATVVPSDTEPRDYRIEAQLPKPAWSIHLEPSRPAPSGGWDPQNLNRRRIAIGLIRLQLRPGPCPG